MYMCVYICFSFSVYKIFGHTSLLILSTVRGKMVVCEKWHSESFRMPTGYCSRHGKVISPCLPSLPACLIVVLQTDTQNMNLNETGIICTRLFFLELVFSYFPLLLKNLSWLQITFRINCVLWHSVLYISDPLFSISFPTSNLLILPLKSN